MSISQNGKVGELITPLGTDVLCLEKFDGFEGLGELFEFHIDALSETENIDFDAALGKSCTIKLKTYGGKTRIYDGILTQAQWVEKGDDYFRYRLVLRPWFALLGYKADCRIFLDKDVKQIITDVFDKSGFNDYQDETGSDYDSIPYCVQYRETDLAFCSRLMEQYGIYYFFKYSEGKHILVLADSRSSHRANPDVPTLPYMPIAPGDLDMKQRLGAWTSQRRFRTGKVQFNDYDYLTPPKQLLAPSEGSESYAHSKMEVYDYPGKYKDQDKGKNFSRFRLEAEQCYDHRRFAENDAPSLFPGSLVTVEKHPLSSENKEYLVVRCNHSYGVQKYRASTTGPVKEVYQGFCEFLPSDIPFRMLPLTPKPRVLGIETAKVVGKQGEDSEEISTDKNGHVWVQFYWDREPQKTCPIRVAQVWAGKNWGGVFIPRIGMEVVVQFLEGDPDRPLITGCVYNGDNEYPWSLPDNKTQSGWKSDSSKGHNGFNELRLEDKKGSEEIYVHAQKDLNTVILHVETRCIGETFEHDTDQASRLTRLKKGDDQLEVDTGKILHNAKEQIKLTVGPSSITIDPQCITLHAPTIKFLADGLFTIDGMPVKINCGG
jgi:type VI secretion system secreted protein VgrG